MRKIVFYSRGLVYIFIYIAGQNGFQKRLIELGLKILIKTRPFNK